MPDKSASGKVLARMKLTAVFCAALVSALGAAFAQTPAPESAKPADAAELEALAKKIDEQNAKIDALSQEILKLEQEVSHIRPGIMIGESTPSSGTSAAPAISSSHPAAAGDTHIVARGETLTAIAKMYKVTVDELQKANHIVTGYPNAGLKQVGFPDARRITKSLAHFKTVAVVATALWAVVSSMTSSAGINRPQAGGYNISQLALHRQSLLFLEGL